MGGVGQKVDRLLYGAPPGRGGRDRGGPESRPDEHFWPAVAAGGVAATEGQKVDHLQEPPPGRARRSPLYSLESRQWNY